MTYRLSGWSWHLLAGGRFAAEEASDIRRHLHKSKDKRESEECRLSTIQSMQIKHDCRELNP